MDAFIVKEKKCTVSNLQSKLGAFKLGNNWNTSYSGQIPKVFNYVAYPTFIRRLIRNQEHRMLETLQKIYLLPSNIIVKRYCNH